MTPPASLLRALAPTLLFLAPLWSACDGLSSSGTATFAGLVVDSASALPIEGATVRAIGTSATAQTADDGSYQLSVEADESGQTFTITASATGYRTGSVSATATIDETSTVQDLVLVRSSAAIPGEPSGPAASITLLDRTSEVIAVSGAGAIETVTLTFVVLDDRGRPVNGANATELTFAIASGPGGGEGLEPSTAMTDDEGTAQVTLTSGTRAGTVQILATAIVAGTTIRSQPVTTTITGGLPDGPHFSVAPDQLNFAGYNRFGVTNEVTAYVGDRFGNPVQPGTAVYFTTDGGIIEGSGVTGELGTTSVTLLSAAPLPFNAFDCGGIGTQSQGYAFVRARTSDDSQQPIEASTPILFSGVTQIEIVTPGLEVGAFQYVVSDQFEHPLAPGSSINVVAEGENVTAIGDVSVILGDHLCPGPGRTQFTFAVVRASDDGPTPLLRTITVSVSSPNGTARLTRSSLTPLTGGNPGRDVFERVD